MVPMCWALRLRVLTRSAPQFRADPSVPGCRDGDLRFSRWSVGRPGGGQNCLRIGE